MKQHQHIGDEALERAVLSAALLERRSLDLVTGDLEPKHFAFQRHRAIFEAMRQLHREGLDVDVRTVNTRLGENDQDLAYVATMDQDLPDFSSIDSYISELKSFTVRRNLVGTANLILKNALDLSLHIDDVVGDGEAFFLDAIRDGASKDMTPPEDLFKVVDEIVAGKREVGLSTGFIDLDGKSLGMLPGQLWILGARPAMGKTLVSLCIARHVSRTSPVAFFSLEMTEREVAYRFLAAESGIPLRRLRLSDLSNRDHETLKKCQDTLTQHAIHTYDVAGMRAEEIAAQSRRLQRRIGSLGLIVVDYIGLIEPTGKPESEQVALANISKALKRMAKDLDCPVLALHQLNRLPEMRANKRPMLSDLRGSGQLEQDADLVLFLYRDEVYHPETDEPNVLEVIVSKNRHGETGTVKLFWDAEVMSVSSYDPHARYR